MGGVTEIPFHELMRGTTSRNLTQYTPIQSELDEGEEGHVSYDNATYDPDTLYSGDITKRVEGEQRMYTSKKKVTITLPGNETVCQPENAPFIILKHEGTAYATFLNRPVSCQAGGKRHNTTKKSKKSKKSRKSRKSRKTTKTRRTNRKNRRSSRRRN